MARRLKRATLARLIVVAACALPLIAVSSAQAAIAGGNPTKTANPNLVSATVTSVIPAKVDICFDKALSQTSNMFDSNFYQYIEIGGYRSSNFVNATGVSWDGANTGGNPNCATASFNVSGSGDINQFTIVTVVGEPDQQNIAIASSNGRDNISDSVPLTGSTTHNGTTGNTTAPDLTGVTTPGTAGNNTITYVFNKATSPIVTADGTLFWYENGGGQVCNGSNATAPVVTNSATGFTVTVTFPAACFDQNGHVVTVNDAVRAGMFQGSAVHAASDPAAQNPLESVLVPNQTGQTSLPDLTGASLHTDFKTVSFTFNQPITTSNAPNPADFTVFMSDGAFVTGCSASIGGSNTVDVSFDGPGNQIGCNPNGPNGATNLSVEAEYGVLAAVDGNAVTGIHNQSVAESTSCTSASCTTAFGSTNYTNSPGSTPVGDNAGAFARGFTTGGDAFATTINQNNGVVTMTFDQRVDVTNGGNGSFTDGDVCIYRADGTLGGCSPAINETTFPGPGPMTVNAQFTPAQVTNGVAVQLLGTSNVTGGCAFETMLESSLNRDECNVPQAISPIGAGSIIRSAKVTKHHSKKHSKKHSTKHHGKKHSSKKH